MRAGPSDPRPDKVGLENPPRTVVFTHGGGRMGNQLLRFAHLLAWTIENQSTVRLINLSFAPYTRGWDEWERHPGCAFPEPNASLDFLVSLFLRLPAFLRTRLDWRIQRAIHRLAGHLGRAQSVVAEEDFEGGEVRLSSSVFMERINACEFTCLAGWRLADWDLVEKHESAVRWLMRPSQSIMAKARATIARLRGRAEYIVALHIRRGDYREFDGGRFYFDLVHYRDWVRQIANLQPNSTIGLLVCGDEKIDEQFLADLPHPWILSDGAVNRGGQPIASMAEMSMADLIIGPPSTFSTFAAFLGKVEILPLEGPEQKLDVHQVVPGHLFGAREHPVLSMVVR